jgi:hypothetical protein
MKFKIRLTNIFFRSNWFARNQYNVPQWDNMSTCGLLLLLQKKTMQLSKNRIGKVVGRNVVSGTVYRGFDQATDYKICISRFSAKQAALRSQWDNMSTCGLLLLFQWDDISACGLLLLFQWHDMSTCGRFCCFSGTTCLPADCCCCLSGTTCLPVDCCCCFSGTTCLPESW